MTREPRCAMTTSPSSTNATVREPTGDARRAPTRDHGVCGREECATARGATALGAAVTYSGEDGPRQIRLVRHERAHVMQTLVLGPLLRHVDETSGCVWVETEEAGTVTVTASKEGYVTASDTKLVEVGITNWKSIALSAAPPPPHTPEPP